MNANELADNLLKNGGNCSWFKEIATMLRQQQAEINTLRTHGYKTQYELLRLEFLQQQAEIERLIMLCDCMTTESNRKGNEIEALKQIIDANNLSQNIGQFVKPTNEPVAWMLADKEAEHIRSIMAVQHDFVPEGCVEIPLYTHPVKEHDIGISHAIGFDDGFKAGMQRAVEMNVVKALTDEEIGQFKGEWYRGDYASFYDLVRALLRKAQEK